MCDRCRQVVRDGGDFVLPELGKREKSCKCRKQCERLVEGVCADCGHYVEHP